ncbi:MAG: SpoIIE family protein phosphatase [Chloroflexi bacterium]|nr:SpoIIE family protein phosphatase [Chloroflexota bacterium]
MAVSNTHHTGDRLALLYRLSQTFNSSLDLNEVLNRVIDEVIEILHAERGFVMLLGPDGSQTFSAARGLERKTIDDPQSQISQSVVQKVFTEGQPILTSDAQTDTRFNMRQSIMLLGLRSILCVPLKVKEEVRGVVYADNRFETGIFTQADLDLLNAIASIAAISIENARLYQVAVETGRLQRELQLAREMQSSFLPQEIPQIDGWQFAARWEPAREVAGDYFDFIPVSSDHLGLAVADVTDKGAAAAMFMVFSNSIVRGSVHPSMSLSESIKNANRLIAAKSTNAMFVSLVYVQLNPGTGQANYVNAGHNPPLYYSARTDQIQLLAPTGMVLGIDPEAEYNQRAVDLDHGDFLVLYTDGLTDAINASEEPFGMERLTQIVFEQRSRSAEEIIDRLEDELFAHTGDITPFDDVTLLIVKRE